MSHYQPYAGKQALLTHESSHDTFDETKHFNWLVNLAGQGIYVHGRVHQQLGYSIYVSDLIHKQPVIMGSLGYAAEELVQALDLMASGRVVHEAGGGEAAELAFALASAAFAATWARKRSA